MKHLLTLTTLLLFTLNTNLYGVIYTTVQAGNWSDPTTWDSNGVPPATLASSDTVNINHGTASNPVRYDLSTDLTSSGRINLNTAYLASNKNITAAVVVSTNSHITLSNGASFTINTFNDLHTTGCFSISGGNLVVLASSVIVGSSNGAILIKNGNIVWGGSHWSSNVKWCDKDGSGSTAPAAQEDCTAVDNACASVLPVELAAFSSTATPAGVQLNWNTESEIENLGFVLERKTADGDFTEIASYTTHAALLGQGSTQYATDYEYVDSFVEAGQTYEYRLGDVDYNGTVTYHATRTVTATTTPKSGKVEQFTVLDAYPNPFNPNTTISYALPQVERNTTTIVHIYDLTGKLVTTLLNEEQPSGWHSVVWNGTDQVGNQVPAGVYLSKVSFGSEVKTIKVMLLK